MNEFLLRIFENDENGNKKQNVEPQYIELNNELRVKKEYDFYRNQYQTKEVFENVVDENGNPVLDEDGNPKTVVKVVTTGIRKYTVELSKLQYKTMTKDDADAFVASIVVA